MRSFLASGISCQVNGRYLRKSEIATKARITRKNFKKLG